ncbi:response regulator transcription factor [Quadrisphaera sp. DSM 44207]|uniref:response regulator transcription factor n=1 Tax=Quadrisphaera sp. DSM 44207 TaxID=1881057 RepID=UPI00088759A1|nr:response regulator transcription factor [Quadrisphaera sp. DSM 44207]SDQ36339.1 DNA-binding response regulator, OmpR family, contains REC and winged-helix (wHTH) domain [Quadrisphaera sp. DSM 44207]
MRILVVEDDDRVARALSTALRHAGYEVVRVPTAAEAVAAPPADLVLLDLGLPDAEGTDVLRALRRRSSGDGRPGGPAVIAVTARSEEASRVRLLRGGADDYVVKPFGVAELLARVEAVLRRTRTERGLARSTGQVLRLGALRVRGAERRAELGGHPLPLTPKEFDLLALLSRHAGAVVRRDVIAEQVWQTPLAGGVRPPGAFRTVDTHVASLRAKLAALAGRAAPGEGVPTIRTERGTGYALVLPDEP